MSIIVDTIKTLVNLRQKENKTLQDCTRQFKNAKDIFASPIGGPSPILTKCMKGMNTYVPSDTASLDKCRNKAYQELLAFL